MVVIAHIREKSGEEEPLYTRPGERTMPGHLNVVADLCGTFASRLSVSNNELWRNVGYVTGLWHDLGKWSREFQSYIRGNKPKGGDHSTAGAIYASKHFPILGNLIGYAIAGHHGGIPDGTELFGSRFSKELPDWQSQVPDEILEIPQKLDLIMPHTRQDPQSLGFAFAMQVRMLFSCLVDADFLATESFMSPEKYVERPLWPEDILQRMSCVLERYLEKKEEEALKSSTCSPAIAKLRQEVHECCRNKGENVPRGIYRLNVPTGGGKTLSALSFALRHACTQGLNRVIWAIPYTSIIDQTYGEFRQIFNDLSEEIGCECVLPHYSGLDLDDSEAGMENIRLMAENWNAPLILTTNVQLFESLFANKPSRCRKIHNCGNAVIIFDEVQTLPANLLSPCLESIKCLQWDYGNTFVLCTATQPAFEKNKSYFPIGWDKSEIGSLLGHRMERELQTCMKRVCIEKIDDLTGCSDLVEHYKSVGENQSVMMIANTIRQAQSLFQAMSDAGEETDLFYLSAGMIPKHREIVLQKVRDRLKTKQRVVLIATRVVEAGVDLSFPIVYRDQAGLDSLAQAAGRCNRHGELKDGGKVYSYALRDFPVPQRMEDLLMAVCAARDSWVKSKDPLSEDCMTNFSGYIKKSQSSDG